jgi:glycosyltransferase involved in cell wall biosynthesis
MKITIVMGFFLPVPALAGGATEKIWHRLGQLMADEGHEVTLISRRWPGLAARETLGRLTHVRLSGMTHTRSLPLNLLLDFWWGLRVLFALPRAEVVVANTISLPVYLRWLKPSAGRVAVVLGRMPKGQNRAYGNVDRVLATSGAVAAQALRENPRLASRLFIFPNPVDWTRHAAAATQATHLGPLEIGYVGRIHPEKGLEQLLDAAVALTARTDLPAWKVSLIGPVAVPQGGGGEAYRDALLARYTPLLGARFEILPPLFDSAALARHYGRLTVFCYPSLAAQGEGLSIAPIEAMAAGAVPVVSALPCYADLIIPGQNGFQFDQTQPDAVASLTAILARLLAEPATRLAVAARAQATAQRFDYAATARALLTEFAQLTRPVRPS